MRNRRIVRVYLPTLIILTALGYFGGLPAWRAVKRFQSRRIAAEAIQLLQQEKWSEAARRAHDAVLLSLTEPEAMRASARVWTRLGLAAEAVKYWKELDRLGALTVDDRRDYASSSLAAGDLPTAAVQLDAIIASKAPPKPGDALVQAQISAGKSDFAKSVASAREVIAEASGANERERYIAAMLLLNLNDLEGRRLGANQIVALARTKAPVALDALVWEARRQRGTLPVDTDRIPPAELIERINQHPNATTLHKLLALDVESRVDLARQEEIVQRAVEAYGRPGSPRDALGALVVWLNEHREYERVIQLVSFDRSLESQGLFLGRLDALGAMGRWNEVRQALESQRFPLDPMIQELYLARALGEMGDRTAAENRWIRARQAAGGSMEKLMTVARYAESAGASGQAEAALRQAAEAAPEVRPLQENFLRFLAEHGDTQKIHRQIRAMLRIWPDDPSLENDDAYFSALRKEGVEAALPVAERLYQVSPTSLPHRTTLALVRLRLGRNADALALFRNITVPDSASLPNTRLVYAAALRACGFDAEARAEAAGIPRNRLNKEERELLESALR